MPRPATAATERAAREGLEATLQGKEQLIETLRATITDLEAQLAKSQEVCDELNAAKSELQETCHHAQVANSVLEQKLDEQGRRLQEETQRAVSREQELNSRYAEAQQASEAREAAMEGRLMEAEARLDDARLEGTSMMEQIAELKAAVASELRAQEELKKLHDRALADQASILAGERTARHEEQQQHAAALSAALSKARAEALARQAADARADCAGVIESLINGVENSSKMTQFRQQLVRLSHHHHTHTRAHHPPLLPAHEIYSWLAIRDRAATRSLSRAGSCNGGEGCSQTPTGRLLSKSIPCPRSVPRADFRWDSKVAAGCD